MAYTTIDKPSDYFNTKLYTGTGSEHAISGIGFAPNLVWLKCRSDANNPMLFDTVRGATKNLYPNLTTAEGTEAQSLKSFDSDGYTLGTESDINGSSKTNVGWNWKAGTSFTNDASSTGVGSIDSAGSVNQDAGFSIIGYSGDTSDAPSTVAHGLSQKPEMMFIKRRTLSGQWVVYNKTIGATHNLHLDSTDASSAYQYFFNNTEPTSSVFTVGDDGESNKTGSNYIAYCFHSVQGYSKIGSYTGNGNADGTFVYTGFKPAWLMVKRTDGTDYWYMYDNKRDVDNVIEHKLEANDSAAEYTSVDWLDFTSNGFKWRYTGGGVNASGGSFIYMAFAENPFVTSTGVPATAR